MKLLIWICGRHVEVDDCTCGIGVASDDGHDVLTWSQLGFEHPVTCGFRSSLSGALFDAYASIPEISCHVDEVIF